MRGSLAIGAERDLCQTCQAVAVTAVVVTEGDLDPTLVASAENPASSRRAMGR